MKDTLDVVVGSGVDDGACVCLRGGGGGQMMHCLQTWKIKKKWAWLSVQKRRKKKERRKKKTHGVVASPHSKPQAATWTPHLISLQAFVAGSVAADTSMMTYSDLNMI